MYFLMSLTGDQIIFTHTEKYGHGLCCVLSKKPVKNKIVFKDLMPKS